MRRSLSLLFLILIAAPTTRAEFISPQLAPVDRLLPQAETYLAAHPKEAKAHYTLARVHYLAFAAKSRQVPSYGAGTDGAVRLPERALVRSRTEAPGPQQLTDAEVLAHAIAAEHSFKVALQLDPGNGLFQLGLASLLEEVSAWLATAKPAGVPPEWEKLKTPTVREAYTKAFDLGIVKDAATLVIPLSGLNSITSYEAARALVRLAEQDDASMTEADRKKLVEAKAALVDFGRLKRGPITPIVFAMQPPLHLDDLLANDVTVDFDLRGYGPAERWSWVKPQVGILVWDPLATGRIESARQLFGSYSFEIFRDNGYDALAALDDNGDGRLTGDEFAGIRVWFDRNSDGVSTADEVVSLDVLGIAAISTRASGKDGIYPMNAIGLTLRDGRTLPTWDWIAQPRATDTLAMHRRSH